MKFGEKLKAERLKCRMTQHELAKKAGLGLNTISNYENCRTYPQNRDVYIILAEALGVSPDYLHNENDDGYNTASPEIKSPEEVIESFKALFAGGSLTESDKDAVMKAISKIYWENK